MSYYLGNNETVIDNLSNIEIETNNLSNINIYSSNIDNETNYLTNIYTNSNLINDKIIINTTLSDTNTNIYNTLSNFTLINDNLNNTNSNLNIIKNDISNLNDIYIYGINKSPKFQRQSGTTYATFMKLSTSSSTNIISLYNPVGSGKTAYIYNLIATIAGSTTSKYARITYRTTNDNISSSGSAVTDIVNLNFSLSNTTNMNIRTGVAQTSNNFYSYMLHNTGRSSYTDFQNEFFEIKEGIGFTVLADFLNGTTDITVSIRWYEI